MKKYQLYREHNNIVLYGDNPQDAIMHKMTIPNERRQDGERPYGNRMVANVVDVPDTYISKVIGIEDTSNSTRGSDKYIRTLCETGDGDIVGIDMREMPLSLTEMPEAIHV